MLGTVMSILMLICFQAITMWTTRCLGQQLRCSERKRSRAEQIKAQHPRSGHQEKNIILSIINFVFIQEVG